MFDRRTLVILFGIGLLVLANGGGMEGFRAVRTILGIPKLVAKTLLEVIGEILGTTPIGADYALVFGASGAVVVIALMVWTVYRLLD